MASFSTYIIFIFKYCPYQILLLKLNLNFSDEDGDDENEDNDDKIHEVTIQDGGIVDDTNDAAGGSESDDDNHLIGKLKVCSQHASQDIFTYFATR